MAPRPMRLLSAAATLLAASILHAAPAATLAAGSGSQRGASPSVPFAGVLDEHPAIGYARRPARDRVARLAARIGLGTVRLDHRGGGGYLASILEALDISPASQLLVFSRTGLQRDLTGPSTPRALYFDDSVIVGFVPGARYLEIAAQDPEQGVIFYTIAQSAAEPPRIERQTTCLTCHVSASTLEVPGVIARSIVVDKSGNPIPQLGFHLVDHRTPLRQRWGGWYVTGRYDAPSYGGIGHMGNVTTVFDPWLGRATTSSNEAFVAWRDSNPERLGYLSAESDIVALLLFDHQMRAMNLLTRLNWESRVAGSEADFSRGRLAELTATLADYLLFADEAPLPGQLTPPAGLASWLASRGPRDRAGRSLRELDLRQRLFRYGCSYMIYSEAFDGLPSRARRAVYLRIAAVLAGESTSTAAAQLDAPTRQATLEILRDTRPEFAAVLAQR